MPGGKRRLFNLNLMSGYYQLFKKMMQGDLITVQQVETYLRKTSACKSLPVVPDGRDPVLQLYSLYIAGPEHTHMGLPVNFYVTLLHGGGESQEFLLSACRRNIYVEI